MPRQIFNSLALKRWLWQQAVRKYWNRHLEFTQAARAITDWDGQQESVGIWWEKSGWQEVLFKHIPLQQHWVALEIGCGVGRLMRPLASKFRKMYGVDISGTMIRFSKSYLKGLSNVETRVGSGYDLRGFRSRLFDLVYSVITFQYIRDIQVFCDYLQEVQRVLKSGGYFVLQVAESSRQERLSSWLGPHGPRDWHGNTYNPIELKRLLKRAGLQVIALEKGLMHPQWLWVTCQKPTRFERAKGRKD